VVVPRPPLPSALAASSRGNAAAAGGPHAPPSGARPVKPATRTLPPAVIAATPPDGETASELPEGGTASGLQPPERNGAVAPAPGDVSTDAKTPQPTASTAQAQQQQLEPVPSTPLDMKATVLAVVAVLQPSLDAFNASIAASTAHMSRMMSVMEGLATRMSAQEELLKNVQASQPRLPDSRAGSATSDPATGPVITPPERQPPAQTAAEQGRQVDVPVAAGDPLPTAAVSSPGGPASTNWRASNLIHRRGNPPEMRLRLRIAMTMMTLFV
jgi:hypothetical protein